MKAIIHKKGDHILIPMKYDFRYKIKTPFGYEKPIARQDNFYNEEIKIVEFSDGSKLKMSNEHRHDVEGKAIFASDLKIGMKTKNILEETTIININKEKYTGILVDFTMPHDVFYANGNLTHNCRLRLDLKELKNRGLGLFAANSNTGSIGVVTLNMPKIGYLSNSEEELFQRITYLMKLAKDSLEIKRSLITKLFEEGLYPYTKRYLKDGFTNHFSTIGLVGVNELCRNYFRNIKKKDWDISTKDGKALTIKILDFMRNLCSDFQVETGNLYNLESTPAESTSYRLAKHDKVKYPNIITAGTIQDPYYTNSSNLPVSYSDNPWDVIKHQNDIQSRYTGGTVAHIFLSEAIDDWKKIKEFIKNIMYNTKLPSITITPTFSHCQIHGYLKGDTKGICPYCKEEAIAQYTKTLEELKDKKQKLQPLTSGGVSE
jgi:anaerobic ribonucleoside-triphosphate reductase